MTSSSFDVAILGTGIGGTILGAMLARHGLRVLLLESQTHPRFAIGESTIPETTFYFRLLARRYGVPEIGYLSSHQKISRFVGSSHGVKRNFSFVWHEEGQRQRPDQSTQYPTAAPPLGPDVHLFRQDTDAWMLTVAARYGCTVHQNTRVEAVDIDEGGVRLATREGREFRASYVVDAGGLKSMLATHYGLRVAPDAIRTRSRAIYTHMIGVRPYDAVGGDARSHGLPSPLSQGTLHHIFDGGWLWVIPFDNHPRSTNPVCSVGLLLDIDRHPRGTESPEQEFWQFIARYPSMQAQLGSAVAVREWLGTDRLQFASSRSVGDRFCMLPHAFSFVDPLYSSGLAVTLAALNGIGQRLIQARDDGDWSGERFAPVDTWTKYSFNYYDRLVAGSYCSWRSFPLWNAWTRVWMIGGLLGAFAVNEQIALSRRSPDPIRQSPCERYPYRAVQGSELAEFAALMNQVEPVMDAVRAGLRDPEDASREIFATIGASGMWPAPWGPISPTQRHTRTFTAGRLYRTGLWLRNGAPQGVREHYYKVSGFWDTAREALLDLAEGMGKDLGNMARHWRDYGLDDNKDWKRLPAPSPGSSDQPRAGSA